MDPEDFTVEQAVAMREASKPLHGSQNPWEQVCNVALTAANLFFEALRAQLEQARVLAAAEAAKEKVTKAKKE